ncbi:MAG: macro domain-containing protein [Lachnospiraceae bacterium]|nr:macro domain-containing protein [Lachnospiraceae bacterium]
MPFTIVRQDITKMNVDAVVNAANTDLRMGGGVCGAIFHAAGPEQLQNACDKLAPIQTGQAAITPGFRLPARYVIHAVGPAYQREDAKRCEEELHSAYTEALTLAKQHKCGSIAFPLISSGIYGYPKKEAMQVAVSSIREFLEQNDMDIYLAVFDKEALSVGEKLQGAIRQYIDENYVERRHLSKRKLLDVEKQALRNESVPFGGSLDDWMMDLDEPFGDTLLRLIDAKGKTDAEVYKRANIDRRLFSKIRSGNGYLPGKRTIIALAIALELSLSETDDLLERAGYALSHSQKFDVIVEFFIVNGIYDIYQINEVLFEYDQPLLGSK